MTDTDSLFPHGLPAAFDPRTYRLLNPDLSGMDDAGLRAHYEAHGRSEGRRCHALADRTAFIGVIPAEASVLEIGPFAAPLVQGPNVRYVDVLSADQLRERAREHGLRAEGVPEITWVSQSGDLSVVDQAFDVVVSSHVVEHQPDFLGHLLQVSELLREGGRYFVLVPDHRYCFDHYLSPSTIAQVVGAHVESRTVHASASVIEHRAFIAHNDARRHWAGDHGDACVPRAEVIRAAMAEIAAANGRYLDVHAWQFTPDSFEAIIAAAAQADLTHFEVERLYPTLHGTLEFWAILRHRAASRGLPAARRGSPQGPAWSPPAPPA